VVNEGISGGDVSLRAGFPVPTVEQRLDRDVFSQTGVTDVIILAGINDITHNATADQVIAGLSRGASRVHARGLQAIGATLPPREAEPLYNFRKYDPRRRAVNTWIRESGEFDHVIDFDAAVRSKSNPGMYAAPYRKPDDRIHPNAAGHQAMGNAVDLDIFRR
jgi:lysophospholipase L1-like esterase